MSSTDQTHKEYLAHQNGVVYWPFTAWDAVLGVPDDLAHKSDITVAINGLNKFDPNKVFTKDEVNAAIVKAISDLQDKIYGGDVNAVLDTIKELQDAYNGSNTIIQRLLTQMANKANVGDSYTKSDSDARYPLKADIPDITPLAKQVDLSLVEKYGLPRNYWVVNSQTNGYSMDSDGHTTIINDKAQTSNFIRLDRSSQLAFMGWGGHTNDQVTVAYFDADKKMISSIIWTQLKELSGPILIEFWKYGPSAAAYVRINANFGVGQRMMVCSEVFQNAQWMPAIEDIQTGSHDTGWISVDGSSYPNNTPENQYGGVQLRVVDQTATLVFYIDHITPGVAFKIPPKYAPHIPMWDTYVRGGTVNYLLDTDGAFTINGPASGQTYDQNSYLNGVITYLIG